jgi:hypothetical protein
VVNSLDPRPAVNFFRLAETNARKLPEESSPQRILALNSSMVIV